jgi:hypothetical protein
MERSFGFYPTLDYYAIPEKYLANLEQAVPTRTLVITGLNRDENGATESELATVKAIIESVKSTYGIWAPRFLEVYQHATAS